MNIADGRILKHRLLLGMVCTTSLMENCANDYRPTVELSTRSVLQLLSIREEIRDRASFIPPAVVPYAYVSTRPLG